VPHLLQYLSSGQYFGRTKVNGKVIRRSLETDVWTTAKLRLSDFLGEQRKDRGTGYAATFTEALEVYRRELASDTKAKPGTKRFREWCCQSVLAGWPELSTLALQQISPAACREWAARIQPKHSAQYFNHLVGTLRLILRAGIGEQVRRGGARIENPAEAIARVRVGGKQLELPEADQFKALVQEVRQHSGGWGRKAGDLIEFLAYSGMRIKSEAVHVTWQDVDRTRNEIVVRGDPTTGTKNSEVRRVPIIEDMDALLRRMEADRDGAGEGVILECGRCYEALERACAKLGIQRLSHHDLRHLFATRCIESGVDIPTVARWLGHKDGGALAMKTYGHLRNEHSQAMAKKVKF
jgi:integrase